MLGGMPVFYLNSKIFKRMNDGSLLPNRTITVNGVNILLYLIGDSAYPLWSG